MSIPIAFAHFILCNGNVGNLLNPTRTHQAYLQSYFVFIHKQSICNVTPRISGGLRGGAGGPTAPLVPPWLKK